MSATNLYAKDLRFSRTSVLVVFDLLGMGVATYLDDTTGPPTLVPRSIELVGVWNMGN